MFRSLRTSLSLFLAILPFAAPLAAQQFGQAVAIDGGDVLILKTGTGLGPAAAYVFSVQEGGWTETGRLGIEVTGVTGHGLSPSIWAGGGHAFVGSGDPGESIDALSYARDSGGQWIPRAPVGSGANSGNATEAGPLDLPGLMSILRPPQRILAADGDLLVIATIRQAAAMVEVLNRNVDTDTWSSQGTLEPSSGDTGDGFGRAVAVTDGRVYVGAPRQGEGVVYVFESGSEGWSETARLEAEAAHRFGSAIAADGGMLFVGAPGAGSDQGQLIVLSQSAAGIWDESRRLAALDGAEGDQFGASVAVANDKLSIGAPGAKDLAGHVYMFRRTPDGDLDALDGFPTAGLETGSRLGSSLAASPGLVVAGAPSANGRVGKAVVYSMEPDQTWTATLLEPSGALSPVVDGEVRCIDGDAAGFSCNGVDLLSFLTIDALGGEIGERVSDLWGWTDTETNREYALVGRTAGLVIVDISNPAAPVQMGIVPANPSGARDIKVYADHVFFTGDGAQDHGLVVFDLTRLRSVTETPSRFEPDARYDGIQSAHNLAIDTESGFAFAVGVSGGGETCGGGLHMVDIRSPKEPTFAGCYTDTEGLIWAGRTHDTQCVVYRGPDSDYVGHQICLASNETALRIVDVTDKQNPIPISAASYPAQAYIHQGWLTEDQTYFYLDDELDELVGNSARTRTLIWDLTDLDDPTFAGDLLGPDASTDHNLYIKGTRMYQANYRAGLRVVDISDPTEPFEVGHFDTTPYGANPPGFNGAWSAYPYFESGTVVVSSMNEGLFILRPDRPLVP